MNIENQNPVTGLHILGELQTDQKQKLENPREIQAFLIGLVAKYNLTELNTFFYRFENGGYTGVTALAESHVAMHSWPELNYLTLDVYLCNHTRNNTQTCRLIFDEIIEFFHPIHLTKRVIER